MFERLQKPFLTVETGEAYQPIRVVYDVANETQLSEVLSSLSCCKKNANGNAWNWFWQDECDQIKFESLESFQRSAQHPLRLGTLTIRDKKLVINLPSFKRACLAVPFFHRLLNPIQVTPIKADFLNKVFGVDERLPHGFTELFKEDELEKIVAQRMQDYDTVQEQVENAKTAEEALAILQKYTNKEMHKRLPYAERYGFQHSDETDPDIIFLGFYIFLRGRELVAIRRWFGETGYTLANAAEESIEDVFGGMNIDILD